MRATCPRSSKCAAHRSCRRCEGLTLGVTLGVLPPPLSPQLDHIVSFLPVRDVVALGQTCHYLRQACDSEGVWRRVCRRLCPRLRQEGMAGARPWKRAAILNYTKGLYFQTFGGRRRYLSKSVAPLLSHGYRKFLPTKEHVFVLDHGGTLFFLRNALVSSAPGHLQWKRACRCVALCRNAKDFTTDPRSDAGYRKYVYVLAAREPAAGAGRACDCVEVYLQSSGQRVFKMTFHAAMRFRQLVLVGQETERALLLLTEEGKIYSLLVNETQLDQPRSYTVQLALRKVSRCLPHLAVRAMTSNQSTPSALTPDPTPRFDLTLPPAHPCCDPFPDKGAVISEVTRRGLSRPFFGTLPPSIPLSLQMPLDPWLPAPAALVLHHLGLLDEFGRLFMQGSNRYGHADRGSNDRPRGSPQLVRAPGPGAPSSSAPSGAVLGCGVMGRGRRPAGQGQPALPPSLPLPWQVPALRSSLCSTREASICLSSHDIDGGRPTASCPTSRVPPARRARGASACEQYLQPAAGLPHAVGGLAKVREAVGLCPALWPEGLSSDRLPRPLGPATEDAATSGAGRRLPGPSHRR
uniref:F-box protein 24 n=1 Tax=Chelonoidis abingdonii TaxID=106734 RepID=A0A8C0JF62_CHEAB